MSRAETTAMLSELVEKRLKNRVSFWASEVNFDLGTSKNRRIDFMGFKPFTPGYVLMPASVELGEFSCYEVKSCMADFKSGHDVLRGRELPRDHKGTGRGTASQLPAATQYQSSAHTIEKRRQARTAFRRVRQVPILQVPRRKRNAVRDDRSERKEDELSIMLDEANAYERGMDDDLTFQTVREIAGTAYMAGRSAPPTAVEIEAVAKRLCWNSCKWDGVDSYAATDEDDAWNYAGEIPGFHEEYIRQAKEMLEIARKAANE